MLTEPTMEKMKGMRLEAMVAAWVKQEGDAEAQSLSFDERLGLLVEAEWVNRENTRLVRSLKEARLRLGSACVEGIDYSTRRELDKSVIRQLSTLGWVREHLNVVITGATGTGKTYIACALAQQACRQGFRAMYRRASRLTDELVLARADGSLGRMLGRLARVDVLILDDWGHAPLGDQERRDLLEIMDDRYGVRSTIMTSQVPVAKWHDCVGDPTHADAICDRVLHNAHKLVLKGPSRRKQAEGS